MFWSPLMSTPSTATGLFGDPSMGYSVNVGGCAPSFRYQLIPLPSGCAFAALMTSIAPSPSTSTATTAFALVALVVIALDDVSPVPSSKLASTHVFPVEQSESFEHEAPSLEHPTFPPFSYLHGSWPVRRVGRTRDVDRESTLDAIETSMKGPEI